MSKSNLQHIQLPNNMTKDKKLSPNDLWVYICIKRFSNGSNKECFPSLKTISEISELSIPTVRESIALLESGNWITVKKFGRSQKYYFTPYKNFEVFSYDFIDKKDISAKEKAYLVSLQQYMYKDIEGLGKVSYSNNEISDKINLSTTKIAKCDKALIDKGYLSLIDSNKRDDESGIFIKQKFFKLNELEQSIIFTLQKQHDDINNIDDRLTSEEKTISYLVKKVMELQTKMDNIEKTKNNQNTEIQL